MLLLLAAASVARKSQRTLPDLATNTANYPVSAGRLLRYQLAVQLSSMLGVQDAMDVAAARSRELPPLQSVAELTSAFEPPTRGAAPAAASAAPSAAGA